MRPYKRIKFVPFLLLALLISACGGGGGSDGGSTPVPPPSSNQPDFDNDGIADSQDPDDDNDGINDPQDFFPFDSSLPLTNQILTNRLSQPNIQVIDPETNTVLASFTTTAAQSDFENAASFVFPADQLSFSNDDPKWYLLKASGGFDIDADNDGVADMSPVSNDGEFVMLVSKEQIRSGGVNFNVFGDTILTGLPDNYATNTYEENQQTLDALSATFVPDINNDGAIGYQDILAFEPLTHSELTLQPYLNYIAMYIAPILNNDLADKFSRVSVILNIERPISESSQIELYGNGEVKSISNIEIDRGDITFTTSRATSQEEIIVSSFIESGEGMSAEVVFMADNVQTFFIEPESFAELSKLKAVNNNQGFRLTIPKELMSSWAASGALVQSIHNDVDVVVVEDDPIVDLILGRGDTLRLINTGLRRSDEDAIELSADSYNEFTVEPIDIRYQVQFVLRNVDDNVRVYGSTSIFEDDSFLFLGFDDPIVHHPIDFQTSQLAGLNSDVRIQIGKSSTGLIEWHARDLETNDYLDGNVQIGQLGYFTGQFRDFNNGFFNQDAEIGVNARLFRLGVTDPLPSINAESDESISEIKVLSYDEAEFSVTGFTNAPWEIGETISVDFTESGIPQNVKLALFYVDPNASCGTPNCLAKMKVLTSADRNRGNFQWQVSDLPIDSGRVTYDSQFESKFCVKGADFSGGFTTCDDIAVLVETPEFRLSVSTSGQGTVTSMPAGINCPGQCSQPFVIGTSITLTAVAEEGYVFDGWSGGGCSGNNTNCTVSISEETEVLAKFQQRDSSYSLTVTKSGSGLGTIKSSPAGIDCGNTCSANFPTDSIVRLTATPLSGYGFSKWRGACVGAVRTCDVTINQAKNVEAVFRKLYSLSIAKTGEGRVYETLRNRIDCGDTCSASFREFTRVVLAADAATGFEFEGFSQNCSRLTDKGCEITITDNVTVSAQFRSDSNSDALVYLNFTGLPSSSAVDVSALVRINGRITLNGTADTDRRIQSTFESPYDSGDTYTLEVLGVNNDNYTCTERSSSGTLVSGDNELYVDCEETDSNGDPRFVGTWTVSSRFNTCESEWQVDATGNSFEFHVNGEISSTTCSSTYNEATQSWVCFGPRNTDDRFATWEVLNSNTIKVGDSSLPYEINGNNLTFNPISFTCDGVRITEQLGHRYNKN